MASSKIQNKLQDELFNKIGLLLDKPISQKSTKQLIQLINHPQSSKQKIFQLLLLNKFRGDLLINLLQNNPFLVGQSKKLSTTFSNLIKNITKYSSQQLKEIWKLITKIIFVNQNKSNNENQAVIYKYCYEELLKEGLKVTNLQKKDILFELISWNVMLFVELGLKDNIRKVIATYVQMFRKFPLQVPNYVKVMGQLITLIRESNINQQSTSNQQKSQQPLTIETLPQIPLQHLNQITHQLNNILLTTKQKPLHTLHNQSLSTLQKIISYKGKQFIKNDLQYSLNKMLEIYLYRKGTRDQARKLALSITKVSNYLQSVNRQKMVKQYSQSRLLQQNLNDQQNPVLIQNVINKTNEFLAKYQVNNMGLNNNQSKNQYELMKNNSKYLKKGDGVGGGKTVLEIELDKQKYIGNKKNDNKIRKDKYEIMLQNCLTKAQWKKNDKNPFQKHEQNQKIKNQQILQNVSLRHKISNLNKYRQTNPPFSQIPLYNQFFQLQNKSIPQIQSQSQYFFLNNLKNPHNDSTFDQNQQSQINQINQLIQLAYSYKFSI